jgi:hypothetical protein
MGRDILRLSRWGEAQEVLEKVTWVESAGELHGKTSWRRIRWLSLKKLFNNIEKMSACR